MRPKEQAQRQLKRLSIALVLSGAFNVVLLFSFGYLFFNTPQIQWTEPTPSIEIPATYEKTNGEILRQYRLLSFDTLVQKLNDETLIENGYTIRDLALASLVNFHSLDIERALGRAAPIRSLVIGKRQNGSYLTVKVFPGMGDPEFEKIRFFLQTEKWPQNAKGLHLTLRKQLPSYDPTLLQALAMTEEYRYLKQLMQGEVPLTEEELWSLIAEADWKTIEEYSLQKHIGSTIRQQLLIRLIEKKSKSAAKAFLKTDGNYVAFRLDDAHLLVLLSLLDEKNPRVDLLRTRLLTSPRSDAVLAAAKKMSGEPKIETPPLKESVYIVQEGDNLWKISRKFRIDMEKIKKQNRLESDTLKPGTSLRL